MAVKNAFYAQSGGVTAVINATACGLIQEARRHPERIGKVLAGRDGIIGALTEDLIDTSLESDADIARLRYTPGGAFGSCRYKLKGEDWKNCAGFATAPATATLGTSRRAGQVLRDVAALLLRTRLRRIVEHRIPGLAADRGGTEHH